VAAVASNVAGAPALSRAAAAGVATAAFPLGAHPSREARDGEMADWLESNGVRLAVCAGYMHLLTPSFLARLPAINVHPSLLPRFPGTRAVEDALTAGVAETGVTVHWLDDGMDTGPVIRQERVPVRPGDTPESLHERLRQVEHRLLPEVVGLWLAGRLGR
jgi:phosphoribosylglycinamide formyltransferase-1